MTLHGRRKIITHSLFFSLTCLIVFLFFLIKIVVDVDDIVITLSQLGIDADHFYKFIIVTVFLIIFSGVWQLFLFRSFRNTVSAEIFFLMLFLVTLPVEGLSIVNVHFLLHEYPDFYLLFVTRILIFTRFLGILFLFASSLFPMGMEMGRIELILGTAILISLTLSSIIPIDSSLLDYRFLYKSSIEPELKICTILVIGFCVIDFGLAVYRHRNPHFFFLALGIILVFIGKRFVFSSFTLPAEIIGFSMISLGIFFFSWKIHEIYLWG